MGGPGITLEAGHFMFDIYFWVTLKLTRILLQGKNAKKKVLKFLVTAFNT